MTAADRRTVWITGATSGIGKPLPWPVIQRGDRLILSARKQADLEALRKELHAEDAVLAPFDLAHTHDITALVRSVWTQTGGVDVDGAFRGHQPAQPSDRHLH